jgi:hypothetical protein
MNPHDLDLIGTCCAIEALAECDTSHWPEGAQVLLGYALDLARQARRENRCKNNLADMVARYIQKCYQLQAVLEFQGSN